jgi:putative restriction endonuclease
MNGTVAVTDPRWYGQLRSEEAAEVNFWKPSARQRFIADPFSPFFFKLPKPHFAICGFGFFVQYTRLPIWLAWDTFERYNGCESLAELEERIREIRVRFGYEPGDRDSEIGCIQIVDPVFFPENLWIAQPSDWPRTGQRPKKYDLEVGEGRRVWEECLDNAQQLSPPRVLHFGLETGEEERYGTPLVIRPRLGQRTFKIAVTEAYERACAITGEHSLPVLDAAHIRPYAEGGEHRTSNGLLLRADLHRLFDRGYLTVTPELEIRVSSKLRDEYKNGHTYYPLEEGRLKVPKDPAARPEAALLEWHSKTKFAA